MIADHGRDTRHPFLDERVVEWVGRQTIEGMTQKGINKPILRELCRNYLKLPNPEIPSIFRKRAIQFGTRLAQRTNIALFGSHSKGTGEWRGSF
jgi:hypothetical protein